MTKNWILWVPLVISLATCSRTGTDRAAQAEREAQAAQQESQKAQSKAQDFREKAQNEEQKARQAEQRANEARNRAGVNPGSNSTPREGPTAVSVPAGAILRVRVDQSLDTRTQKAGDRFTATLEEPVSVNGRVILPRGTRFVGAVTRAKSSGRLSGRSVLAVRLDSFRMNGKTYRVGSSTVSRMSGNHKKRDIGIIGGTSAAGAMIGAIAGGGKGAAIGAGAGAAAGTAGAAATGKMNVRIPAETVMLFRLKAPIAI
jgi:hypothetical protein